MGECLEGEGAEEDDEVFESGLLDGLFQPCPDSPNIKSDNSSVLVESRVLSVLQEPSSELLRREELSLDESSSGILCSWRDLVLKDSKLAELSGGIETRKFWAALDLDMVFFPLIQEGMALFLGSQDIILFLIKRGALGEHLYGS